ncbi:MAG: hypothetical protein K8J09_20905 [Planctomycetes bacterium]|nr:hypothetical protein [Planctomycetota bacterium]MCC7399518.1 hypothetical protein [Planctomycetota bacterium]
MLADNEKPKVASARDTRSLVIRYLARRRRIQVILRRFLDETGEDPPEVSGVDDLVHELRDLYKVATTNRSEVVTRINRYAETVEWSGRLWQNVFVAQRFMLKRFLGAAGLLTAGRLLLTETTKRDADDVSVMRARITPYFDRLTQLVEIGCVRVGAWIDDVPGPDELDETFLNYKKWWGYFDSLGSYPAHKQGKRIWRNISDWFHSNRRATNEVSAPLSCGVRGTGHPTARQRKHRQPLTELMIDGKAVLEETGKKGRWRVNHPLPHWFARSLNEMDHLFSSGSRK